MNIKSVSFLFLGSIGRSALMEVALIDQNDEAVDTVSVSLDDLKAKGVIRNLGDPETAINWLNTSDGFTYLELQQNSDHSEAQSLQ